MVRASLHLSTDYVLLTVDAVFDAAARPEPLTLLGVAAADKVVSHAQ